MAETEEGKRSIMGIGAHPDDLEISCGGTLAAYAGHGHRVTMCHVCRGDKGHFRLPPGELRQVRCAEAGAAARLIGAGLVMLDVPDGEAGSDWAGQRLRVVEAIREAKPDLIITHAPEDYHPDHVAVQRMVVEAAFLATVPYVSPCREAIGRVPEIRLMDTYAGVNFVPTEYVDITATLAVKQAMMESYRSQVDWLKEHDGLDILEFIAVGARYRGFQGGCRYAEGFRKHVAGLFIRSAPILT